MSEMYSKIILILFLFVTYAFLGWVVEVIYHVINFGRFINRGFLKGPYCPIYGFGMIFILTLLTPYENNFGLLFILSILITTIIELIGGFLMEKLFQKRWWDYSDMPFNFKGYICLKFSIYWGIGALLVVKILHPSIEFLYNKIPHIVIYIYTGIMVLMMLIDLIATISSILKLNKELSEIEELSNKIKDLSDRIGERITESVLNTINNKKDIEVNIDARLNRLSKKNKRLIKAFPKLSSKTHNDALIKLKERIYNDIKNKKIK